MPQEPLEKENDRIYFKTMKPESERTNSVWFPIYDPLSMWIVCIEWNGKSHFQSEIARFKGVLTLI